MSAMLKPEDPRLTSFIPVGRESHFPLQNLPYGVFKRPGWPKAHCGVAIGEQVLDLTLLELEGLLQGPVPLFQSEVLNPFMAQSRKVWRDVRQQISVLLRQDNPTLPSQPALLQRCLHRQEEVTLLLPAHIGDYTDFYASKEHASNVGAMFRDKDNPLLPNWRHLPVGYHGRASSVVVSGTPVRRPRGQVLLPGAEQPVFQESQRLDFELELAVLVGGGNALGQPIPLAEAGEHLFGFVLMNDWSARDIQRWEYQPLGPFISKSFATSISPWVVSSEALAPFLVAGPEQEPEPLPYLRMNKGARRHWDVQLQAALKVAGSKQAEIICRTNAKYLYWSMDQMLAHHTCGGCNLRAGDLLASGTISGAEPGSFGSLLELASAGSKPVVLADGVTRSFLADGDELSLTGWCEAQTYKVGFGAVTGLIYPCSSLAS